MTFDYYTQFPQTWQSSLQVPLPSLPNPLFFTYCCFYFSMLSFSCYATIYSKLMFLWWPAILYSVLNSVCLLMANKWMMMMIIASEFCGLWSLIITLLTLFMKEQYINCIHWSVSSQSSKLRVSTCKYLCKIGHCFLRLISLITAQCPTANMHFIITRTKTFRWVVYFHHRSPTGLHNSCRCSLTNTAIG